MYLKMTSAVLVNFNCNVRSLSERVLLNVTFDIMMSRYCIFYLSTDALAEQCVTYSTCSESKHKIAAETAVSAVTAVTVVTAVTAVSVVTAVTAVKAYPTVKVALAVTADIYRDNLGLTYSSH